MKTDKEWEARARELGFGDDALRPYDLELAIRLGREMADERAKEIGSRIVDGLLPSHPDSYMDATARAASIARSTITKPKEPPTWTMEEAMREPAKVMVFHDEAAIRADEREKIAQQIDAKNARAWAESKEQECDCAELVRATVTKPKMDLAAWCERVISAHRAGDASGARHALRQAQACADSPNPKTREQVLEEALRNILRSADDHVRLELRSLPLFIQHEARRALEWRSQ